MLVRDNEGNVISSSENFPLSGVPGWIIRKDLSQMVLQMADVIDHHLWKRHGFAIRQPAAECGLRRRFHDSRDLQVEVRQSVTRSSRFASW